MAVLNCIPGCRPREEDLHKKKYTSKIERIENGRELCLLLTYALLLDIFGLSILKSPAKELTL